MPVLTNARQETFTQNWFIGKPITKAALIAGYSPKWVASTASRLSRNVNVLARYNELQAKLEEATISTEKERRKILTQIQRATIADFVDENGNLDINDKSKLKTAAVAEIKTERTRVGIRTTLKLRDPVGAITEHNKMERVYETAPSLNVDNRTITIIVPNQESKDMLEHIGDRLLENKG